MVGHAIYLIGIRDVHQLKYLKTLNLLMQYFLLMGYIYCFSNESMPGILKVGMTLRTPPERLREANSSDTWRPPTPFCIEFAKQVNNPLEKEKALHRLLTIFTERIHPRREFFRVNVNEVQGMFDLVDGTMWEDPALILASKRKAKIEARNAYPSDVANCFRHFACSPLPHSHSPTPTPTLTLDMLEFG